MIAIIFFISRLFINMANLNTFLKKVWTKHDCAIIDKNKHGEARFRKIYLLMVCRLLGGNIVILPANGEAGVKSFHKSSYLYNGLER